MNHNEKKMAFGRRELLARAGVLGASAIGLGATSKLFPAQALGSPLPLPTPTPLPQVSATSPAAALLRDQLLAHSCVLTPDSITGPYYLDLDLVRRNITEGRPGLPLTVFFRVVQQSDCSPIPNAVIDIWQADAHGVYSGFVSQGTPGLTYLRGVQFTDIAGFAFFEDIYPGWYPGRTTHIHLKVYPTLTGTPASLTTQLYFDDALTNLVYELVAPYTQDGKKDTTNAQDGFYTPETKLPWIIAPGGSALWAGMTLVVP